MSDFLTVDCASTTGGDILGSYTNAPCDFIKGRAIRMLITAPGVSVECIQNSTEIQGLIDGLQAAVVNIEGTRGEDTANEIENTFRCGPPSFIEDYSASFDWQAPFLSENQEFWERVDRDGIGEFYYLLEGGFVMKPTPIGGYTITVQESITGSGIKARSGTISWDRAAGGLDRPFGALSTIFGCNVN